jgi:hypothetical protein
MSEATRKTLEENLTAVQGQLRSKEQQAALEKKALEDAHAAKTTELEKRTAYWESLYRDSTIERALFDAGIKGDAFSPEQVIIMLRPATQLIEGVDEKTGRPTGKYRPMVKMEGVDPQTGAPVELSLTPEDAVKRMKELPDKYGNLFKPNVVSGIGAGVGTGGIPGDGRVDPRKLTPQQYRQLREEHPERLGLRPRKPR